jgi:glucose-1-phosphate thymidylyltransferase
MWGIILAGGLGTRMGIYTKRVGNKHLMPIYDRVMIEFPIMTLVNSGITNITIVTGNRYSGQFVDFLGNGKEWGIETLNYAYQFGEGGIADALQCAKYNIPRGEQVAVILGDNIFENDFRAEVMYFTGEHDMCQQAHIFLKEVIDPHRFGVFDQKNIHIVEKPKYPPSNMAVTGFYLYDYSVFNIIQNLKPSSRGELEITDVNNHYLGNCKMRFTEIDGFWHDAGTPDSIITCSEYVKNKYKENR